MYDDEDGADLAEIGYCPRCGANMAGEPPAEIYCGDCRHDEH